MVRRGWIIDFDNVCLQIWELFRLNDEPIFCRNLNLCPHQLGIRGKSRFLVAYLNNVERLELAIGSLRILIGP